MSAVGAKERARQRARQGLTSRRRRRLPQSHGQAVGRNIIRYGNTEHCGSASRTVYAITASTLRRPIRRSEAASTAATMYISTAAATHNYANNGLSRPPSKSERVYLPRGYPRPTWCNPTMGNGTRQWHSYVTARLPASYTYKQTRTQ